MGYVLHLQNNWASWTKDSTYVVASGWMYVHRDINYTFYVRDGDAYLSAGFTLSRPANASKLTIQHQRINECDGNVVLGRVQLIKPVSGAVTLYNASGALGASYIFNNTQINAYLNEVGTYYLHLYAYTRSCGGPLPPAFHEAYVKWGDLSLYVDTDLPGIVTGLSAAGLDTSHIRCSWTPLGGTEDSYTIYYRTLGVGAWSSIPGITTIPYDVGGLASATWYEFTISATSESGEGPQSAPVTARTIGTFTKVLTEVVTPTPVMYKYTHFEKVLTETVTPGETIEAVRSKELLETVTPTEHFTYQKAVHYERTFVELVSPIEHLTVRKIQPFSAADEKILAFQTDKHAWTFPTGAPTGTYETPDDDFGMPGIDKTLRQVCFESASPTPHTVMVYVSVNAGDSWLYIGSDTMYKGKLCFVDPWLTGEQFRLRFVGAGLDLCTYTAVAIVRGEAVHP